jgi:hypothetical protein
MVPEAPVGGKRLIFEYWSMDFYRSLGVIEHVFAADPKPIAVRADEVVEDRFAQGEQQATGPSRCGTVQPLVSRLLEHMVGVRQGRTWSQGSPEQPAQGRTAGWRSASNTKPSKSFATISLHLSR